MAEKEIEKGAASIFIELENGDITVTHGTDKAILLYIPNAKLGTWDKLWEQLRLLKAESAKVSTNRKIEINFGEIDYWIDDDSEMDESDIQHVGKLLTDGFVEGELCHGQDSVRGYWKLIK